jgi:hypothetical protein
MSVRENGDVCLCEAIDNLWELRLEMVHEVQGMSENGV